MNRESHYCNYSRGWPVSKQKLNSHLNHHGYFVRVRQPLNSHDMSTYTVRPCCGNQMFCLLGTVAVVAITLLEGQTLGDGLLGYFTPVVEHVYQVTLMLPA